MKLDGIVFYSNHRNLLFGSYIQSKTAKMEMKAQKLAGKKITTDTSEFKHKRMGIRILRKRVIREGDSKKINLVLRFPSTSPHHWLLLPRQVEA